MALVRNIAPEDEFPPLVLTPLHQLHFLVIDDEGPSLNLTEGLLESMSVAGVRKAPSVSAAVNILADFRGKIDCIISDHHTGGMSGLALLQRIRAGGRNSIVPRDMRFIMSTAHPSKDLVRAAAQLDVDGFISKPIDRNVFLKTIHLAFSRPIRLKATHDYVRVALPADGN